MIYLIFLFTLNYITPYLRLGSAGSRLWGRDSGRMFIYGMLWGSPSLKGIKRNWDWTGGEVGLRYSLNRVISWTPRKLWSWWALWNCPKLEQDGEVFVDQSVEAACPKKGMWPWMQWLFSTEAILKRDDSQNCLHVHATHVVAQDPHSINLFIYLFLAVLGLSSCPRAFSIWGEWGPLSIAAHGPLIAVASPAAEHVLQACGLQQLGHAGSVVVACGLQSTGSAVAAHRPSRSAACGIPPDQGSNPCPLHWQADSQPLRHQGSPVVNLFNSSFFFF